MKKSVITKAALAAATLLGAATSAAAGPHCVTVNGRARLDFAPDCQAIAAAYPGPLYLGQLGTCFTSTVVGTLAGSGLSGLTAESATSGITMGVNLAPLVLKEAGLTPATDQFGLQETRQFFTARSILRLANGTISTADAGVLARSGSTEQLEITGGTGSYAGATGTIYLTGNVIQNWGSYSGSVCLP